MNARPYWNPYLAGAALGLVLLATFMVVGNGLGASAFPKRTVALVADNLAPAWTAANPATRNYVASGENPLKNWFVIEVAGVLLGGFIAALTAGRFKAGLDKGPRISNTNRLRLALAGGVIMGIAAGIARGCTSGQALSGGATLAAGSWLFMIMVFVGGYALAYFVRREWV